MVGVDHLNIIERKLIDNLRTGTFNTVSGTDTAWSSSNITVFGQFPTTDQVKYPCIICQMDANGIEQQFMDQKLTFGASDTEAIGELYGVAFNLQIAVDRDSSITVSGAPYKERRLLNYLMVNCANVLMDCNFNTTNTEVVERHFAGFRNIGYNPDLEIWAAEANMIVVFKNNR
tara:strand:- start:14344 stop:14865 length:522 start_codon:yes stop_codon:yes gene_type:complete